MTGEAGPEGERGSREGRRRDIVGVGLLVGLAWTVGAALPIGTNRVPPEPFDLLLVVAFSLMLATYVAVGWLMLQLVRGSRAVTSGAWLVAIGAAIASVGNFVEDALVVPAAGEAYALGVLAMLAGLTVLGGTFALTGRAALAALMAATFVGTFLSAGEGLPAISILWLGVAAWGFVRGRRDPPTLRSSSP